MPDQLFCSIRKRWINATPEEKIRQFLIKQMVEKQHYPPHYLILERGLHLFPHLDKATAQKLPQRRVDLIVVAKDLHPRFPFYPLLLIECKAVPITLKTMRQVMGYNHFLSACFVAVTNQFETRVNWFHPQEQTVQTINGLPDFPLLIEKAREIYHF